MPRNEAKPLSPADADRQERNLAALKGMTTATVFYQKRNGQFSESTGPIAFFNGKPGFDTGSVTLDTTETKGRMTTVNLHNIITIE